MFPSPCSFVQEVANQTGSVGEYFQDGIQATCQYKWPQFGINCQSYHIGSSQSILSRKSRPEWQFRYRSQTIRYVFSYSMRNGHWCSACRVFFAYEVLRI